MANLQNKYTILTRILLSYNNRWYIKYHKINQERRIGMRKIAFLISAIFLTIIPFNTALAATGNDSVEIYESLPNENIEILDESQESQTELEENDSLVDENTFLVEEDSLVEDSSKTTSHDSTNADEQINENLNRQQEVNSLSTTLSTFSAIEVVESATSKLGQISKQDAVIYKTIGDNSTSFKAGKDYTDKVFYIKKQANYGGQTYYLLSTVASDSKGVVGWIKAADIFAQDHVAIDHKTKTFYIKGSGWAYSQPWGAGKDTVYRNLQPFKNQKITVNLTEKVGNNIWYRGFLENGQKVWIGAWNVTSVKPTDITYSSISKLGQISNKNAVIYKTIGDSSSSFKAGNNYTDKVFYIKKQANYGGQTYYLLSTVASDSKGVVGWIKASDIFAQNHVAVDHKTKTFYIKGSGWAYSQPWGAGKDTVYRNLQPYMYQKITVNLTEKVGNNIWYRGFLENGQKVWIGAWNVTTSKPNITFSATSKLGQISKQDAVIYKTIGVSSSSFKAGKDFTDKVFYIKKQANYGGQIYYLLSTVASDSKGVVGWIKAADIFAQDHVAIDHKTKTFYIKGSGWAYSQPWGAGKDTVYRNLQPFKNQKITVNLTEKVGNNIWYRGFLENGQKVWIGAWNVTTLEESTTSKLGQISNKKAKIYPVNKIGIDSSAFEAGTNHTDKVYYIKKQAKLNGQTYYLLSTVASASNGLVGWIKSSDIFAQDNVAVDHQSKTFYIKGTGWAYSQPWGAGKDVVYKDLTPFKSQTFKVDLTEKVGSNIWYHGYLENGKKVWIGAWNVVQVITKNTIYNYSLDDMVKIQAHRSPRYDSPSKAAYNQPVAYVSSDYITRNGNTGTVKVSNSLNVRFEPNTKSKVVGTLRDGDKVTIIDEVVDTDPNSNRVWYAIHFNHGYPEGGKWQFPDFDDLRYYIDPNNFTSGRGLYQFLVLSESSGVTAKDLHQELKGKGILDSLSVAQAFVDAANTHSINEFYLLSHAILETGHGKSDLSNGSIRVGKLGENTWLSILPNGKHYLVEQVGNNFTHKEVNSSYANQATDIKKTYNMFGIGAYDGRADVMGSVYAYRHGWFTPEAAVKGGAKFIGDLYIHHQSYKQNTLYKMRWNPGNPGVHQYATDIGWAYKQTYGLFNYYQKYSYLNRSYDIPLYQ